MALKTGDRLGAYEIVGLLGHGAMGEVYRARDTRLGRDVAVKVLPAAFVHDADRLARLEREARLISQVNHPNICTLFDIVEEQQAPCLIFELVEGETLQQRLLRGPMPLREVLRSASGIAAALEAAHSKGIIHRDLKPSNIKITAGGAIKVLDFGVAKLARDGGSELDGPDLTLTLGGTKEGVLVGTVAYVSPEQAMGDRVDGRSDIWSFGCLLYEMLTARRAFPGVAVADTLGAVMRGEPDWMALPGDTPPQVRTLIRRCLEKDRGRRLADIADAHLEIEDLLEGRSDHVTRSTAASALPAPAPRRSRWVLALAFLSGVILATAVTRMVLDRGTTSPPAVPDSNQRSAPPEIVGTPPARSSETSRSSTVEASRSGNSVADAPREPVRTAVELPDGLRWAPAVNNGVPNTLLAISPDGRLVVYSARDDDVTALWLRSLAFDAEWRLPGTEGGVSPFWSPDGASIGFFADRQLKRLDLNGLGTRSRDVVQLAVRTLCEVRSQRGGTWGPDDTIVFAPFPGVLKRIPADGGLVSSLTNLELREPHHVRPQFLAGTKQILYRVTSSNGRNNAYYVTSLEDGNQKKPIARLNAGNVAYAQGHLLFMQNHTLMAQPFDVNGMATSGTPRPIAEDVLLSTGSPPVFGVFSVSQAGRLVYLSQGGDFNDPMTMLSNWAESPARR